MADWILKRKSADYEALSKALNVDPLIVRILLNRNLQTKDEMFSFLYGGVDSVHKPELLEGIKEATLVLRDKISENKKIRIVGDYDVDGVCATTILYKGLKALGANVDFYIPERFKDGYGLNLNIIDTAKADKIDTILTCDNGISAVTQVEAAKEYGMTVIITDHHEVPYEIVDDRQIYTVPAADVVVDPKLADSGYPFKEICGAYVAYKLMEYMLGKDKYSELLDELIQYAALATVSDVMELTNENRILVKHGINLMKAKPPMGLKALIELNDLKDITAFSFGFILGPSINAAGRLKEAKLAINLLIAEDLESAMEAALVLKELNDERKRITEKCTDEAIAKIESTDLVNQKVIVADVDDCHEGVIGIVAGRLKEKYHRPVLVVTKHEGVYKGSGRSIDEYNLYEEINKVSVLFIKYGGHKGAAGFSFEIDKLEELRKALNDNCTLTDKDMTEKLYIDADMPFSYCNEKLMDELSKLEPFGNGNESPVFARTDATINSCRLFGAEGKVGKYKITDQKGRKHELTLFKRNAELRSYLNDKYGEEETNKLYNGETVSFPMSVAYYPSWNEYNGIRTIQFIMIDYK